MWHLDRNFSVVAIIKSSLTYRKETDKNLNNFAVVVTRCNGNGGWLIWPAFLQSFPSHCRLDGRRSASCNVTQFVNQILKCLQFPWSHNELEAVVLCRWNAWHRTQARESIGELSPCYQDLLSTSCRHIYWLSCELATGRHCNQQTT